MYTTEEHNTAQNSSNIFPLVLQTFNHSSDVLYQRRMKKLTVKLRYSTQIHFVTLSMKLQEKTLYSISHLLRCRTHLRNAIINVIIPRMTRIFKPTNFHFTSRCTTQWLLYRRHHKELIPNNYLLKYVDIYAYSSATVWHCNEIHNI